VIASLLSHNIKIALPLSEHLPFDLIAISTSGQMRKVSVKYRAERDSKIEVRPESNWSNAKQFCTRKYEPGEVDAYAIYCPNTKTCYFVRESDALHGIILRMEPPGNGQTKGIRMAKDFVDPNSIFV